MSQYQYSAIQWMNYLSQWYRLRFAWPRNRCRSKIISSWIYCLLFRSDLFTSIGFYVHISSSLLGLLATIHVHDIIMTTTTFVACYMYFHHQNLNCTKETNPRASLLAPQNSNMEDGTCTVLLIQSSIFNRNWAINQYFTYYWFQNPCMDTYMISTGNNVISC